MCVLSALTSPRKRESKSFVTITKRIKFTYPYSILGRLNATDSKRMHSKGRVTTSLFFSVSVNCWYTVGRQTFRGAPLHFYLLSTGEIKKKTG